MASPSSKFTLWFQPILDRRDILVNFFGEPSGFVKSKVILPLYPTTFFIVSANSLIVTSLPVIKSPSLLIVKAVVSLAVEFDTLTNIDLTENLGNEKIAYIKIDGNEISAKIPSQNNIIDQIGFDIKDIFVFDETGTRVRS